MRTVIEFDPVTWHYSIYVLEYQGDRGAAATIENGNIVWVSVEPGTKAPPFLRLDKMIYESIMGEALNLGLPNRPDELQDCRKIRDRMLSLIELSMESQFGK